MFGLQVVGVGICDTLNMKKSKGLTSLHLQSSAGMRFCDRLLQNRHMVSRHSSSHGPRGALRCKHHVYHTLRIQVPSEKVFGVGGLGVPSYLLRRYDWIPKDRINHPFSR